MLHGVVSDISILVCSRFQLFPKVHSFLFHSSFLWLFFNLTLFTITCSLLNITGIEVA